jgi:hypothetical protein
MDYMLVVMALIAVEMFNVVVSNAWAVAVSVAASGVLVSMGMRFHDDRCLARNIIR